MVSDMASSFSPGALPAFADCQRGADRPKIVTRELSTGAAQGGDKEEANLAPIRRMWALQSATAEHAEI
jgi:hypothetical protein